MPQQVAQNAARDVNKERGLREILKKGCAQPAANKKFIYVKESRTSKGTSMKGEVPSRKAARGYR